MYQINNMENYKLPYNHKVSKNIKDSKVYFEKIRPLLIQLDNLPFDLLVNKEDEKDYFRFEVEKNYIYLHKRNKNEFMKLMYKIQEEYWHWIDFLGHRFETKFFFTFCLKAYKTKVPFSSFYSLFKNLEKKIPRAYALITNEDKTKVLLVKNFSPNQSKMEDNGWGFSGGKLEIEENGYEEYTSCLKRELKEELGLFVEDSELEDHKTFFNFGRNMRIFHLTLKESEGNKCKPANPFEIEQVSWHSINELPKLVCVAAHGLTMYNLVSNVCDCKLCKIPEKKS